MTHKWLIRLVIGALVILLIAAIIRALTPSQPEVPLTQVAVINKDQTQSSFSNIVYTGRTLTPPAEVVVAQATTQKETKEQLQNRLITAFTLKLVPGAQSTWTGPEYSATYNSSTQAFEVSGNETQIGTAQLPPVITLNQATDLATAFVTRFYPAETLTTLPNQARYLSGGDESEEVDPGQARMIEVPFAYTIEDTPVLYNYQRSYPILITVTNQLVAKAVITPNIRPPGTMTKIRSISVDTAIEKINTEHLGSIINARNPLLVKTPLTSITQGTFRTVSFEYRLDEASGLIYPYYHFLGELTNAEGQTFDAEVITPAIQVDTAQRQAPTAP